MSDPTEPVKMVGDAVSTGVVIGALVGWLPHIAALLTVVWMALRIWEMDTTVKAVAAVRRLWRRLRS